MKWILIKSRELVSDALIDQFRGDPRIAKVSNDVWAPMRRQHTELVVQPLLRVLINE
jgi:hypothetical protein